jgi:hypothetical protein
LIVWFSSVPSKLTFSSARALIQDSAPYSARKLVCWFFLSCVCRAHLPPPEIFLHRQYSVRASILGLVLWPLLVLLLQPIFYSDWRRALFACSVLLCGCLCARAPRARQLASLILFCRSLEALKNQFLPGCALLAPLVLVRLLASTASQPVQWSAQLSSGAACFGFCSSLSISLCATRAMLMS